MAHAWWKWLGLAGVVGIAATGAVMARQERVRRAYTPDEVRERLHARHAAAEAAAATGPDPDVIRRGTPGSPHV